MSAYYIYLISSLPMLNFSAKPPFSLEDFFAKCQGLIPEAELALLRQACCQEPDALNIASTGALKEWVNFETNLRNELVRVRARRKKIDPVKFLRSPDNPDARLGHLALAAYRSSSILEAEKMLDLERWSFLESLTANHYFDFVFLLAYVLKLKILARWDALQKADPELLFNEVLVRLKAGVLVS